MEIHLAEQDDTDASLHEIRHEPGTLAYWVYLRRTWTTPQQELLPSRGCTVFSNRFHILAEMSSCAVHRQS